FISLLPYVIVRYNVGAIEFVREIACSLSVIGLSAMMCAGAIGASSFKGLLARIGVIVLFMGSMMAGGSIPLVASANVGRSEGCGVFYHINAVCVVVCFTLLGLALARSRLRLVVHAY
nr:hypothetical protein [Shewanella ferrihydritica]